MSAVGPCATFASAQNPLPKQGDHKHDNANHDSNGPRSITLLRHIFSPPRPLADRAAQVEACPSPGGRGRPPHMTARTSPTQGLDRSETGPHTIVSTRASPHELRTTLRLQFHQQLLDAVFFFKRRQTLFHVVGGNLGLGLAEGFAVGDLAFHAVEGGGA